MSWSVTTDHARFKRPVRGIKMHHRRCACSFSGRLFSCATWVLPFVWVSTMVLYWV